MANFVRLFKPEEDVVVEIVNNIWYKYDTDRSGALNRRETLRFVDDFLSQRGQPPATRQQFTNFFDKFDVNGDGKLSKREMANFVRLFKPEEDDVIQIVNNIWYKYDVDRSGALNRKETLRFVDDILAQRGQPPANMSQFTRFYDQFDSNGDGLISKNEMA